MIKTAVQNSCAVLKRRLWMSCEQDTQHTLMFPAQGTNLQTLPALEPQLQQGGVNLAVCSQIPATEFQMHSSNLINSTARNTLL